jgi:7-cyano-7-deazaguanine reductase
MATKPSGKNAKSVEKKASAAKAGKKDSGTAKRGPRKAAAPETSGLTKLGSHTAFAYDAPHASILEAFPNKFPQRDYIIIFEHPEFTSLCPMTGQPDFGTIRVRYVPGERCVESKSFKLYMGAFRNHGSFMESIVNTIAEDLISVLAPRRLTVEGIFNVRGGTGITVIADHTAPSLATKRKADLSRLW